MRLTLLITSAALLLMAFLTGACTPPLPPGAAVPPLEATPAGPTGGPDLPPAEGPVRFSADFSTPDLSGWTAIPNYPGDDLAQWRVEEGRLQQLGDYDYSRNDKAAVLLGPDGGAEFQLDAALLPQGIEPLGLVWHAQESRDVTRYNRVVFGEARYADIASTVRIEQVEGSKVTVVAEGKGNVWTGWTSGQWFVAGVRVAGPDVVILIDGKPVLRAQMAAGSGRVGVYATADRVAAFDNVRVQQPASPLPVPPAPGALVLPVPRQPLDCSGLPTPGPNEGWRAPQNMVTDPSGIYTSSGAGDITGRPNGAVFAGWTEAIAPNGVPGVVANYNDTKGGSFAGHAVQTLDGRVVNNIFYSATDAAGRVHLAWVHYYDSNNTTAVWYARWENGVFTRPPGEISLTSETTFTNLAGIAADASGRVHIMWGRRDSTPTLSTLWYTVSTDGGNTWAARSNVLSASGQPFVSNAAIGADNAGDGFVAWTDDSTGAGVLDLHVRIRNASGAWENPTNVSWPGSGPHYYARGPSLAARPNGGVAITYSRGQTTDGSSPSDIYYSEWSRATGWRAPQAVTTNPDDSYQPRIGVDLANKAHIIWSDVTGTNFSRPWYAYGTSAGFTAYTLACVVGETLLVKDPALAVTSDAVHISYSLVQPGNIKDRFYDWRPNVVATPTPIASPTPTPIFCPGARFQDVCLGSTFWQYIEDLSVLGAISGYPCGGPGEPCDAPRRPYFRPNANLTRGQVAKVVTLAFGISDTIPGTQQTFQDVAPNSTFWIYIERLVGRGAISGYPCGGPGEPCVAPTNRPYFRPNNNVTRGQLTKIVAIARNWGLANPGTASFNDVPVGSTFFQYVETAKQAGIISGYPCGSPGEPCPGTYFRPNNNVTRGQATKIIDLARLSTRPTVTPTAPPVTNTPTSVPTNTPTNTPTRTPTVPTNTPVPSNTPVASATPGPSNTPTNTRTNTPTNTPNASVTPAPPTLTLTATHTPTPAVPPTSTPTITATQPPGPIINSITPVAVEEHDVVTEVTINGQNFGAAGSVVVNGVPALIDSWTPTQIQFHIDVNTPPGSMLTVIRNDSAQTSTNAFSVYPRVRPYVFSYTPSSVCQGDTATEIRMAGQRFGVITGTVVLAGVYTATITSWTDTEIDFHIAPNTPAFSPIFVHVTSPLNGQYKEYGGFHVLPCGSPTPTVTSTPVPGTATPTAVAGTPTVTVTGTPPSATPTPTVTPTGLVDTATPRPTPPILPTLTPTVTVTPGGPFHRP